MRARIDPSPALLDLARAQAGVLSLEQCANLGLPRRSVQRLVEREWFQLGPDVFLISREPATWSARAWAGVLRGGEGAKLGFAAAGHALELCDEPAVIDVWIANSRSRTSDNWVFHHDTLNRRCCGELPTTTVEDTVIDLCPRLDADAMAALIGKAVGGRKTTIGRLAETAEQRKRLGQRELIYEVLGLAGAGVHSALERRFVTDVERPHDLPAAERQIHVRAGVRVDVFYEAFGVMIELDGTRYHSGSRVSRDLERDNINATLDLATLRYGWADVVSRPCDVAAQVAAVLHSHGWEGAPRACVRCRRAQSIA